MALPNELHPLQLGAGSASAYQIEQSLRFDSADSNYMERTFSSAGNRQTWTYSCWFKHGKHSQQQTLWSAGGSFGVYDYINFSSNSGTYKDFLEHYIYATSGTYRTSSVYRDDSAWYHVVIVWDTTNATAADRLRQYINGVRIDTYSSSPTIPQNTNSSYINTASKHRFGLRADSNTSYTGQLMDGYMAEVHFIDGTAVDPDGNLGEFDVTGVWRPIQYTGSYGSNGVYLKFDPSATNGIGHDHSGNGNNFTPTAGFSTSGTGTDVMSDTPTTNYATINPLTQINIASVQDGNLVVNAPTSGDGCVDATIAIPSSGKFYVEATLINITGGINQFRMGLQPTNGNNATFARPGDSTDSYGFRWNDSAGTYVAYDEGTQTSYGTGAAAHGDIVGIAIDRDNGEIKTHINNTYFNSGNAVITGVPTIGDYLFRISADGGSKRVGGTLNFGQREFAYPPGTSSATGYFNTVTYTGTSATQSITGVGFQPDFVWIKHRNGTGNHNLFDSVRGTGKQLYSNLSDGEGSFATSGLTAFGTDGFTLGDSVNSDANINNNTYVAWCWKAGGTASSNTDGTITASVSADQAAGFSVVSYTGTSTAGTVGHGLGVAPSMVIVKNRDSAQGWRVYHSALSSASKYLVLETTAAEDTASSVFNDTAPTSSVFSVGDGTAVNNSGDKLIAYCWTDKTGVIKTGSYEGNGLASGLSVDVGFKPAMVIIKNADAVDDWNIIDNRTSPSANLRPNSNSAEDSAVTCYLTPTGFTVATGNSHRINFANETFVYIAFAENFSADATYKALNTANLPAPTIKDGSKYFSTTLYTGVSGSQSVDAGMATDLAWIKSRTSAQSHSLTDRVRGNDLVLQSNETSAETSGVIDLTSTGVTIGNNNALRNASGVDYVLWSWLAGGSGSSNTDGSITSTVSANPTAGFSIVTYTGTNANATVGHGLGVEPRMVICKSRNSSSHSWYTYHASLGSSKYIYLNLTAAAGTGAAIWNGDPTSTTFTLGTSNGANQSTVTYVAYCFAEVEGYSKFGSYTGNGSTDGVFIYTGFKVGWWMVKKDGSESWYIRDTTRDSTNAISDALNPNAADAEGSYGSFDFLSNGIKIRESGTGSNTSGSTYIYAAFAENPFGGDGVSPATAR